VGLGTDCSGGYATGMLSVIRNASSVSRCLAFTETSQRPLDMAEVFYLATLGGASLCRLDDRVGNFLPGKEFDALRIKPRSPAMWEKEGEATERVFERWLWCGDDRDIADVWVRGRRVGGAG
jgi:guanine deaminase